MNCETRKNNTIKMKKKVGIFPGSFNPIHIGHLIVAEQIVNQTALEEIWFMLTPQNPFKVNKELLDENKRLEMVEIAVADNPKFKASNFEFEMEKPNYTYKTLQALNNKYGNEIEFSLLIGYDNYVVFDKWKNYKSIINNFNIYVYKRKINKTHINNIIHDNIKIVDAPAIEVSGTDIRAKIDKNQSIKYLVRREVQQIIEKNSYYLGNKDTI